MLKIIANNSWSFDEPLTSLIKVAQAGFIGHDRREFAKRASERMLSRVDKIAKQLRPGEVLIHLIAMGATEATGPNRNGDGFKAATLRETHPTFVKFARFYRNHKNRDPSKSYGIVLASDFNEPMQRVDLCVALNGNKEAAERNGGLIADRELSKLASGDDLPVSMGCKIDYDECSWCGHRSDRPANYCRGTDEGGKCAAGGLYNKMGSLVEINGDLHHLHANNPPPLTFFDITNVEGGRGADRIAFVTGKLADMHKEASDRCVKSADLAAQWGLTAPMEIWQETCSEKTAKVMQRLEQLAGIESHLKLAGEANEFLFTAHGRHSDVAGTAPVAAFNRLFGAMCKYAVCLTPAAFAQVTCGLSADEAENITNHMEGRLVDAFQKLANAADLQYLIESSPYQPDYNFGTAEANWAVKLSNDFGFSAQSVRERSIRGSLRCTATPVIGTIKTGQDKSTTAEKFAMEYALYQLAFLSNVPEKDFQLTARALITQNQRP